MHAAETEELDAAVLEVNLNGELVWPAAKVLRARRIPFAFATGYSGTVAPPPELAAAPWIEKPVEPERLASVVAALVEDRCPGRPGGRGDLRPDRYGLRNVWASRLDQQASRPVLANDSSASTQGPVSRPCSRNHAGS